MATNARKVIGIVSTLAVIGMTAYAVKKYYDSKKQDEQAISLDEAKQIVEEGENEVSPDDVTLLADGLKHVASAGLSSDEIGDIKFTVHDSPNTIPKKVVAIKASEVQETSDEDEEDEQAAWYEGPDPQEVQDSKGHFEEDEEVIDDLKYEPNTAEAREQFINMELVVLGRNNDTRDIVSMLYSHPFIPMCDEDENLKVRLIDHRIKFFGMTSKWLKDVSFGDLIMYYGKSASFHMGNDVRYWVDYFLTCANLNNITLTSHEIEETIRVLNMHNFFNEDLQTHGLFGLNSNQMTKVMMIARSRVDGKATYDVEYNLFTQGLTMGNG